MDFKKKISQKSPKLSRMDRWRKNPIQWVVLLTFIFSIGGYYMLPMSDEWLEKTGKIKEFQSNQSELESQRDNLNIQYEEIKNKYEELANETLKREKQIFPKDMNISKIVKILELYSLILAYDVDGTNYFKLESVNFSPTSDVPDTNYRTTKANIRIIGARSNIYNFITYLESGEIPKTVKRRIQGIADIAVDLRFLEQNLLPLATLDSIRINEFKSSEINVSDLFAVEIQVNLFSQ